MARRDSETERETEGEMEMRDGDGEMMEKKSREEIYLISTSLQVTAGSFVSADP